MRSDEIACRMQALMTDQGLSQTALARAAGLAETCVRDIIEGKSCNPHVEHFQKLAAALGVPVQHLLPTQPVLEAARSGKTVQPPQFGEFVSDVEELAWLRLWRSVDDAAVFAAALEPHVSASATPAQPKPKSPFRIV